MRSLFLVLLLANLLLAAGQFGLYAALFPSDRAKVEQLNAEKLRVVRDAPRPATGAQRRSPNAP